MICLILIPIVSAVKQCICLGSSICNNDDPCNGISAQNSFDSIESWSKDSSHSYDLGMSYNYVYYDYVANFSLLKRTDNVVDPIKLVIGINRNYKKNTKGVNITGIKKIVFKSDYILLTNDVGQDISFYGFDSSLNITASKELTIECKTVTTAGFLSILIHGDSTILHLDDFTSKPQSVSFKGKFFVSTQTIFASFRKLYPPSPLLKIFYSNSNVCIGNAECAEPDDNSYGPNHKYSTFAEFESEIGYFSFRYRPINIYTDLSNSNIPLIKGANLNFYPPSTVNNLIYDKKVTDICYYSDYVSIIDRDSQSIVNIFLDGTLTIKLSSSKFLLINYMHDQPKQSIKTQLSLLLANDIAISVLNISNEKTLTITSSQQIKVYSNVDLSQITTKTENVEQIIIDNEALCICSHETECESLCNLSTTDVSAITILPELYEISSIKKLLIVDPLEIDFSTLYLSNEVILLGNITLKNIGTITSKIANSNQYADYVDIETHNNMKGRWTFHQSDSYKISIIPNAAIPLEFHIKAMPQLLINFIIKEDNCYFGYGIYGCTPIPSAFGTLRAADTPKAINFNDQSFSQYFIIEENIIPNLKSYISTVCDVDNSYDLECKQYVDEKDVPIINKNSFKNILTEKVYSLNIQTYDIPLNKENSTNTMHEITVYGMLYLYDRERVVGQQTKLYCGPTISQTIGKSLVRIFLRSDSFYGNIQFLYTAGYQLIIEIFITRTYCYLGKPNSVVFESASLQSFTLRTYLPRALFYYIDGSSNKCQYGSYCVLTKNQNGIYPSICITDEYTEQLCVNDPLTTVVYASLDQMEHEIPLLQSVGYEPLIYSNKDISYDMRFNSKYKVVSAKSVAIENAQTINFYETYILCDQLFTVGQNINVKVIGRTTLTTLGFFESESKYKYTITLQLDTLVSNFRTSKSASVPFIHVSSIINGPVLASPQTYELNNLKSIVIKNEVNDLSFYLYEDTLPKCCVCDSDNYETDCMQACGHKKFITLVKTLDKEPNEEKIIFVGDNNYINFSMFLKDSHTLSGNVHLSTNAINLYASEARFPIDREKYIRATKNSIITLDIIESAVLCNIWHNSLSPNEYYPTIIFNLTNSDTKFNAISDYYTIYSSSKAFSVTSNIEKATIFIVAKYYDLLFNTFPSNIGYYTTTTVPEFVTCICEGTYSDCKISCGNFDEFFVIKYDSIEKVKNPTEKIYINGDFIYEEKWEGDHYIISNGYIKVETSVNEIMQATDDGNPISVNGLRYKLQASTIYFNVNSPTLSIITKSSKPEIDITLKHNDDITLTYQIYYSKTRYISFHTNTEFGLLYTNGEKLNDLKNSINLNDNIDLVPYENKQRVLCFCASTTAICSSKCNNPEEQRIKIIKYASSFTDSALYDIYDFWYTDISDAFDQSQFSGKERILKSLDDAKVTINNVGSIERGDNYVKINKLKIDLSSPLKALLVLKGQCSIVLKTGSVTDSLDSVELNAQTTYITGTFAERENAFKCTEGKFGFEEITNLIRKTFVVQNNAELIIYEKKPSICICNEEELCELCSPQTYIKYNSFSEIQEEPSSDFEIQLIKNDYYPFEQWHNEHTIVGLTSQSYYVDMRTYSNVIVRQEKSVVVGNVQVKNVIPIILNKKYVNLTYKSGASPVKNIMKFDSNPGVFYIIDFQESSLSLFNKEIFINPTGFPTTFLNDEKYKTLFNYDMSPTFVIEDLVTSSSIYCITSKNMCGNYASTFYDYYTSFNSMIAKIGEPQDGKKILLNAAEEYDFSILNFEHSFLIKSDVLNTFFNISDPKKIKILNNGININDKFFLNYQQFAIKYNTDNNKLPVLNIGSDVENVAEIRILVQGQGFSLKVEELGTKLPDIIDLSGTNQLFISGYCNDNSKSIFSNVAEKICGDSFEEITCIPGIIQNDNTVCTSSPIYKIEQESDIISNTEPKNQKIYIKYPKSLSIANWKKPHMIYNDGLINEITNIHIKKTKLFVYNVNNAEIQIESELIGIGVRNGFDLNISDDSLPVRNKIYLLDSSVSINSIIVDLNISNEQLILVTTLLPSAKISFPEKYIKLFKLDSTITYINPDQIPTEPQTYDYICLYNSDISSCLSNINVNSDINLVLKESKKINQLKEISDSAEFIYIAEYLEIDDNLANDKLHIIVNSKLKMLFSNPLITAPIKIPINLIGGSSATIYGIYETLIIDVVGTTIDLKFNIHSSVYNNYQFNNLLFNMMQNDKKSVDILDNLLSIMGNKEIIKYFAISNDIFLDIDANNKKYQYFIKYGELNKIYYDEYKIDSLCLAQNKETNINFRDCYSTKDQMIYSDFHRIGDYLFQKHDDVNIYIIDELVIPEEIVIDSREYTISSFNIILKKSIKATIVSTNGEIKIVKLNDEDKNIKFINLIESQKHGVFTGINNAVIKILPSQFLFDKYEPLTFPTNINYQLETSNFETIKGKYSFSVPQSNNQYTMPMNQELFEETVLITSADFEVKETTQYLILEAHNNIDNINLAKLILQNPKIKVIEVIGSTSNELSFIFPQNPVFGVHLILKNMYLKFDKQIENTFSSLQLIHVLQLPGNNHKIVGDNISTDIKSFDVTQNFESIQLPTNEEAVIDVNEDGNIIYKAESDQTCVNTNNIPIDIAIGNILQIGEVKNNVSLIPSFENGNKESQIIFTANGDSKNDVTIKEFNSLTFNTASRDINHIPLIIEKVGDIKFEAENSLTLSKIIPNDETTLIKSQNNLYIKLIEINTSSSPTIKSLKNENNCEITVNKIDVKNAKECKIVNLVIQFIDLQENSKIKILNGRIIGGISFVASDFSRFSKLDVLGTIVEPYIEFTVNWGGESSINEKSEIKILENSMSSVKILSGIQSQSCESIRSNIIFNPPANEKIKLEAICEDEGTTISIKKTIIKDEIIPPEKNGGGNNKPSLNTGIIIGIVIGCVVLVGVIIFICIYIFVIRPKKKRNMVSNQSDSDENRSQEKLVI